MNNLRLFPDDRSGGVRKTQSGFTGFQLRRLHAETSVDSPRLLHTSCLTFHSRPLNEDGSSLRKNPNRLLHVEAACLYSNLMLLVVPGHLIQPADQSVEFDLFY